MHEAPGLCKRAQVANPRGVKPTCELTTGASANDHIEKSYDKRSIYVTLRLVTGSY